jgi:tetratricopeptide (TPR) repeat protein
MGKDDALTQFIEQLMELKLHAGSPPLREISERCDGTKPSVANLSNLFTRNIQRPPRWELVFAVVTGLIKCAAVRDLPLNSQESDARWWRQLLERLERNYIDEKGRRSSKRDGVLAELRQHVREWNGNRAPTLVALSGARAAGRGGVPRTLGDAYVPRADFDEELQAALQAPADPFPFLLVYGDETAGKTTSAWNAVQATLDPRTEIIVPRGGQALAQIAFIPDVSAAIQVPALIWADGLTAEDMERLTGEVLERLSSFAIVVGTISSDDCGEILSATGSQSRPVAKAAFRRVYLIHLAYDPALAEEFGDEENTGGSYAELGADPRFMWLRLNTARTSSPAGMAVVRSAIDCRRAGLTRPLTEDELKRLFPLYLAEITRMSASDELFASGMEWAQESEPGSPPLLRPAHYPEEGRPAWAASHLLRSEEASWELPLFIWPDLIEIADPGDCLFIARQADEAGEVGHAAKALEKAATRSELYLRAKFLRGVMLRRMGNLASAKDSFTAVIDRGASEEASAAAYFMGGIAKEEEDDAGGAVTYWKIATESPGEFSLMAWYELGRYYAMSYEREKAVEALDRDFSEAAPEIAMRASTLLGIIRNQRGSLQEFLDEWENGAAEGSADAARVAAELADYVHHVEQITDPPDPSSASDIDAALAEGRRHSISGDPRSALRAFREAAASAVRPDVRAAAFCMAGDMADTLGLLDEAKDAYAQCVACNGPRYSASAALSLGAVLNREGDIPEATRAWQKAEEIGDPATAAKASFNIGIVLHEAGDNAAAVPEFERAFLGGASAIKAKAAMMLASVHEGMDADAGIVDDCYERAMAVGDLEYSPVAAVIFGKRVLAREGSSPKAMELMRIASESSNSEARGEGAWRLGCMLEKREDFTGAMSAYEAAIKTGSADWGPAGNLSLGLLHGVQNRKNIGMGYLQAAYESRHHEFGLEAAFWLGMFYWWDGTHENRAKLRNAEDMLREVMAAGEDSGSWAPAGNALGSVLLARGDRAAAAGVWRQVAASRIEPHATEARMKLSESGVA